MGAFANPEKPALLPPIAETEFEAVGNAEVGFEHESGHEVFVEAVSEPDAVVDVALRFFWVYEINSCLQAEYYVAEIQVLIQMNAHAERAVACSSQVVEQHRFGEHVVVEFDARTQHAP